MTRTSFIVEPLILVLQAEIDNLKNFARGAADHSVEIEIDNLTYGSPNTWGLFRSDKLAPFDWDCQLIRTGGLTGVFGPGDVDQPNYWLTAENDSVAEGSRKIPAFAQANLFSLKIVRTDGTLVGAYSSLGFGVKGSTDRPKSKVQR